eukprot:SM000081S22642  [mRNA]  locus=s81:280865:282473:- [translate_table: standard]
MEQRLLDAARRKKRPPRPAADAAVGGVDKLAERGRQWWMIQVPRNLERAKCRELDALFRAQYPDKDCKFWVPLSTRLRPTAKGVAAAGSCLYPGTVLVRAVMDRGVHDAIRGVERVRGFFGNKVGPADRQILVPAPIPSHEVRELLARVRADEDRAEAERPALEAACEELRAQEKAAKAAAEAGEAAEQAVGLVAGASVRVVAGPFRNFVGKVVSVEADKGKVSTCCYRS